MSGEGRSGAALPGPDDLPDPGARIHMMGIGGAGVRALALLLADRGDRVSGCDSGGAPDAPELRDRGVTLADGHDPTHPLDADLLIHTAAVPEDHEEIRAARRAGVTVMGRARATGAVLNGHRLAAVTGTHGKTTTTAMAALACEAAGLDPTALVGGRVPAWNAYARTGGNTAVAEADEYDRAFLELDPDLAVVTSLEHEHVDVYASEAELEQAVAEFAGRASGRDGVLYCGDDDAVARMASDVGGALSYGTAADAAYRIEAGDSREGRRRCTLFAPEGRVETDLPAPGAHNVLNAAAALATALRLGAEPEGLDDALAGFTGVDRRLEVLADRDGLAVVDDYAHHPTEVRAALGALRERWPHRRLVAVFQPHLYSRTSAFADAFADALSAADRALVLPIYPAREEPVEGVDSALVADAAPADRVERADPAEVTGEGWLEWLREEPTVVAYLGAGDVTDLARRAGAAVGRATGGAA